LQSIHIHGHPFEEYLPCRQRNTANGVVPTKAKADTKRYEEEEARQQHAGK
jgi:hypothetical protein